MIIGLTTDQYEKVSLSIILCTLRWIGIPFSEVTQTIFKHSKKNELSAHGMKLGLHLPNVGNFGYDFSSIEHKAQIDRILEQINKFKQTFRFLYAVFHPPESDTSNKSYNFYIQNLQKVNIPLVIENIPGFDSKQMLRYYQRIEKDLGNKLSGFCLDIPHAYLTKKNWITFYNALSPNVKVIHLSDCIDNEDLHLPFGFGGKLNLDEILETLVEKQFNNILNFEIKPPSPYHIDIVFQSYLRAMQYFNLVGTECIQKRMKLVSTMGRRLNRFLKIKH